MQKARTRPDPVSCQLCRAKKLKCNRVQPCSNCVARGVSCHFLVPPRREPLTPSHVPVDNEILRRLIQLEERIQGSPSVVERRSLLEDNRSTSSLRTIHTPEAAVVEPNRKDDEEDEDIFDITTREEHVLVPLSGAVKLKICSAQEIIDSENGILSLRGSEEKSEVILAILPCYPTALCLFQCFEATHDHLCRLMHLPTVKAMMKSVYLRVRTTTPIQPGQVALLLSILSIAAYFYNPTEHPGIVATEAEAVILSKLLTKGALDVLDHTRRVSSGQMEEVQAYIIMSTLLQYLDGFSGRACHMLNSATLIAKNLCLHRLDVRAPSTVATSDASHLKMLTDREIKRRVMWYIASADWLSAALPGPQEGAYTIHAAHLSLRHPNICANDDVTLDGEQEPDGTPQPTGQAYLLEVTRLAGICREIVDTMPLETRKLAQLRYEVVVEIDKKMQHFVSELPFFFKVDDENRKKTEALEFIYPSIPLWRHCLITTAHLVRCRLHQRFMLHQFSDNRYAYSRQACLESARIVIKTYEATCDTTALSFVMARIGKAVQMVHNAVAILITDFRLNREDKTEAELSSDISPVLEKLVHAKEASPLAAKALNSLRNLLNKHKISLPVLCNPSDDGYITPESETQSAMAQFDSRILDQDPFGFGLDELWYGVSSYDFNFGPNWGGDAPGLGGSS